MTGLSSEPCRINLRPVFLADQPIGTLALFGFEDGDPIERDAPERTMAAPARIVGLSGDRMVLLHRPEVRFAEADGNDVWLVTATRGACRPPSAASTSSRRSSPAASSCASTGASSST